MKLYAHWAGPVVWLLCALPAAAQIVRGEVGIGAGVSTDQRGVRSSAVTIAPSVLFAPDPRFSATLGASGTRFGAESRAMSGSAGLGLRLPLAPHLALSASGAGSYTTTSFDAAYALGDITPTVELNVAGVTAFGGAHVATGRTTLNEAVGGSSPLPGLPTPTTRSISTNRTSIGAVFGGVASFAGSDPSESTTLFYREEHATMDSVGITDRLASATFSSGNFALSIAAGLRDARDEKLGFGSVALTQALTKSLSLQASAGSYPSNRVLGTMRGTYASVGLLLHGARRIADAPSAPVLRGAPAVPKGATRLIVSAPGATRVEIAGDWNKWALTPATRASDGRWFADVWLAPGEYRYAFKVDGQRWVVPDGAASVDDGFGGKSALVAVR